MCVGTDGSDPAPPDIDVEEGQAGESLMDNAHDANADHNAEGGHPGNGTRQAHERQWCPEHHQLDVFLEEFMQHWENASEDGNPEEGDAFEEHPNPWNVPLYQGAGVTVEGAVRELLKWKSDNKVSNRALEALLRMLNMWYLPAGVPFPISIYMCKKQMQTPQLHTVRYHVCATGNCYFDPIPREEYDSHSDDTCKCGVPRFKTVDIKGSAVLQPHHVRVIVLFRACNAAASSSVG